MDQTLSDISLPTRIFKVLIDGTYNLHDNEIYKPIKVNFSYHFKIGNGWSPFSQFAQCRLLACHEQINNPDKMPISFAGTSRAVLTIIHIQMYQMARERSEKVERRC